jgi:hypothetical protein
MTNIRLNSQQNDTIAILKSHLQYHGRNNYRSQDKDSHIEGVKMLTDRQRCKRKMIA